MSVESVEREVLRLGLDDWVYFAEVADEVRFPEEVEGKAADYEAVRVLAALLNKGLIEVGDVIREKGFVPWPLTAAETVSRLNDEVSALEASASLGDVCWISNTEAGHEAARSVE